MIIMPVCWRRSDDAPPNRTAPQPTRLPELAIARANRLWRYRFRRLMSEQIRTDRTSASPVPDLEAPKERHRIEHQRLRARDARTARREAPRTESGRRRRIGFLNPNARLDR